MTITFDNFFYFFWLFVCVRVLIFSLCIRCSDFAKIIHIYIYISIMSLKIKPYMWKK